MYLHYTVVFQAPQRQCYTLLSHLGVRAVCLFCVLSFTDATQRSLLHALATLLCSAFGPGASIEIRLTVVAYRCVCKMMMKFGLGRGSTIAEVIELEVTFILILVSRRNC